MNLQIILFNVIATPHLIAMSRSSRPEPRQNLMVLAHETGSWVLGRVALWFTMG